MRERETFGRVDGVCGVTGGLLEDVKRCHQRVSRTILGKSKEDDVKLFLPLFKLGDGGARSSGGRGRRGTEEGSTDSCRVPPEG